VLRARRAHPVGALQRRREGLVLGRRDPAQRHRLLERDHPAVPQLRSDARGHAGRLDLARVGGAALHRDLLRPHLHGNDRRRGRLREHAHRLHRRDLGEGAPRPLVQRSEIRLARTRRRRSSRRRTAHEGEAMKKILIALAGALVMDASYAKLPAPPAKTDAEKVAEADKAAAAKAKEAAELGKAQDKAVANYKKHKGVSMDARKK